MKPLRLAVVGLGWIGRKHTQLIVEHDDCLLVGLCDADDHHAAVAREFGVPFHTDIEQLLENEAVEG
ncbi:MAG: Gfo/Idh/MocA family oxidoreductase, partial [Planctomycetota bacterium]|nr:Gfo/Idh/MocA family oxidoreductase [Planctomycetota bacterium]